MPDVGAPFVTVYRLASYKGELDGNRPHYHPDTVEVCAILRGQLDWFAEDERYVVRPGDVLVVPAKVVHGAIDSNLQPCDLIAVHLAPEQLSSRLSSALNQIGVKRLRSPVICDQIVEVLKAHQRQGDFFEERVAALGALLAVSIVEAEPSEEEQEVSRLIRLAQRELLDSNLRLTIEGVAHRLGVSAVWLHQLFVREIGVSPGDWTRAKRISEAKRRLCDTEETHEQIARDLGYSSGQSFATSFRRESGMTPSEYRKLHRESGIEPIQRIYVGNVRETWEGGVRIYPPSD